MRFRQDALASAKATRVRHPEKFREKLGSLLGSLSFYVQEFRLIMIIVAYMIWICYQTLRYAKELSENFSYSSFYEIESVSYQGIGHCWRTDN